MADNHGRFIRFIFLFSDARTPFEFIVTGCGQLDSRVSDKRAISDYGADSDWLIAIADVQH